MPRTYSQILLHIVFSTKNREDQITSAIRDRLYRYLGGTVRSEGGVALAIGGMPDHVHMLVGWRTDRALSALMQKVKGGSSRWLHKEVPDGHALRWQGGYAVFSVSKSNEPALRSYIENQDQHHRGQTFGEEIAALLRAHGVEFDEHRIFE